MVAVGGGWSKLGVIRQKEEEKEWCRREMRKKVLKMGMFWSVCAGRKREG